jgi:hypothetical protein
MTAIGELDVARAVVRPGRSDGMREASFVAFRIDDLLSRMFPPDPDPVRRAEGKRSPRVVRWKDMPARCLIFPAACRCPFA